MPRLLVPLGPTMSGHFLARSCSSGKTLLGALPAPEQTPSFGQAAGLPCACAKREGTHLSLPAKSPGRPPASPTKKHSCLSAEATAELCGRSEVSSPIRACSGLLHHPQGEKMVYDEQWMVRGTRRTCRHGLSFAEHRSMRAAALRQLCTPGCTPSLRCSTKKSHIPGSGFRTPQPSLPVPYMSVAGTLICTLCIA